MVIVTLLAALMQNAILQVINRVLASLAARQAVGITSEVLVGERAHLILGDHAVELVIEHFEHLVDGGELARRTHRVVLEQVTHCLRQLREVCCCC